MRVVLLRFVLIFTLFVSGQMAIADFGPLSCKHDLAHSGDWLELKKQLDEQEIHVSSEDRLRLARRWLADRTLSGPEKAEIFEQFRIYLKAQHYIWACKRFVSDDGKYIIFMGAAGHSLIFADDGRMFAGSLQSLPDLEFFYDKLVENGPVHLPTLPAAGIWQVTGP